MFSRFGQWCLHIPLIRQGYGGQAGHLEAVAVTNFKMAVIVFKVAVPKSKVAGQVVSRASAGPSYAKATESRRGSERER